LDSTELADYGVGLFKKFDKKLKKALDDPKKEKAVHGIRTTIKRIKAYLKLIHSICPGFKFKKTFRPWKLLFKELAGLRDWHVYTKVADEKLQTSAKAIISKSVSLKGLGKRAKIFDKKLYDKVIDKISSHLENTPVFQYMREYNEEITLKIREFLVGDKTYRRRKLHVLRKHLKEYYYNLDVLGKSEVLQVETSALESWLKNMTDMLGDWHDAKSLTDQVRKDSKKKPRDANKKAARIKALTTLKTIQNQYVIKLNRICSDTANINSLFPPVPDSIT